MKYIQRFLKVPNDNFFIFGPRGTGKSSWMYKNLDDAYFINLNSGDPYRRYSTRPELIESDVENNPDHQVFVIDEIQRVPEMLNSIHFLIEKYKNHRFVITSSSARKLRRAGVNLMAGRALLKKMHPFMAGELGEEFNIEKALEYGLIPMIWMADVPKSKLHSYIGLYLREEIDAEGLVRNVGLFASFLEVISFSHGQILNVNNIARESLVTRAVAENYINILEDLMLGYKLPSFVRRPKRNLVASSKFYFFDTGIYRALRPVGHLYIGEIMGAALEGLVLQHLKAWIDYSSDLANIYFWRTKNGLEVDFVIYGQKSFYAIEVKSSQKIHSKDLRGLKEFKNDYPEAETIMVYGGQNRMKIEGVLCIPVKEFLVNMMPDQELI